MCAFNYTTFLLQTAPLVSVLPVVVGVVSTGVTVVVITVVVVAVCLLIVAKHKHRKYSLGEDYTAATTTAFGSLLLFFTALNKHVYWKQPTIENRLTLSRATCIYKFVS